MNQKGFTLIELLVVVLIIGVLAAVAMPMYQVAAYKSRAAELMMNARSLHDSAERYHLENWEWPYDLTLLDVQLPYTTLTDDGGENFKENGLIITPNGNIYGLDVDGYVAANLKGGRVRLSAWFVPRTSGLFAGAINCRAPVGDRAANQACLSLGGKLNGVQDGSANVYAID